MINKATVWDRLVKETLELQYLQENYLKDNKKDVDILELSLNYQTGRIDVLKELLELEGV